MSIQAEIGPSLESFVNGLVASGRYSSQAEVLREALRLFQEREDRLSELDSAIARGLADADAGRVTPADEVFAALEAKHQVRANVDSR